MTDARRAVPASGEVHLWRAVIGDAPAPADLAVLTIDEQERFARLRPPAPRAEYVTGRALLRRVVSSYLGTARNGFAIAIGEHGKPTLAGIHAAAGLTFSLSHTRGLSCLAVAVGAAVGVDVEVIRRELQHEKMAARFFSTAEVAQLRALDHADQSAGFFRIWTRKESYLKGRGDGITHGLANFDVLLGSGAGTEAAVVEDRHDPASPARWSMVELQLEAGFVGAVALEHPGPIVVTSQEE